MDILYVTKGTGTNNKDVVKLDIQIDEKQYENECKDELPKRHVGYYVPSKAIENMKAGFMDREIVYIILSYYYGGDTRSIDETIYIWDEKYFDIDGDISDELQELIKLVNNSTIEGLYYFDTENDAKEYFKYFLLLNDKNPNIHYMFTKRFIKKIDNYEEYIEAKNNILEEEKRLKLLEEREKLMSKIREIDNELTNEKIERKITDEEVKE